MTIALRRLWRRVTGRASEVKVCLRRYGWPPLAREIVPPPPPPPPPPPRPDLPSLGEIALMLESARRIGASGDKPEGVRYIKISDTLAVRLAAALRAHQCNRRQL